MLFYLQSKSGPRAKWRNTGVPRDFAYINQLAREIDEMGGDVVRVVDLKGTVAAACVRGRWTVADAFKVDDELNRTPY